MPKRWKVVATVTLNDGQQQVDQDTSTEEYDGESEAKEAFNRKKNA